jgi:hypothetical protein
VLRWRQRDAVCEKRSMLNVVSVTKSKTLLVLYPDRGKGPYSPGSAPMASGLHKRPEKVREKLRVCFTPSKKRERRTRRSPIWFEPDRSRFLPIAVENSYVSTKNVSKSWAAYPMLPPGFMTRDLPRSHHQMRLPMRHDPTYGHQTAVSSNLPRFPRKKWRGVLEVSRRCHCDAVCVERSRSDVVSKTKSKPLLALLLDQGKRLNLPSSTIILPYRKIRFSYARSKVYSTC